MLGDKWLPGGSCILALLIWQLFDPVRKARSREKSYKEWSQRPQCSALAGLQGSL